ncbi:hypothetical protein TNCV_84511 [Trichonephila clavipes]|nr:hypothetical protein TNCV_84511 [Trichonephila clavipes]
MQDKQSVTIYHDIQVWRTVCGLSPLLTITVRTNLKSCGSPVVKVLDHGRHVMISIPTPQKTCRVGQQCTLNLPRSETSSRWCGS